jgi:hypothetical protein
MQRIRTGIITTLLLVACVTGAWAALPQTINYQGYLKNTNGTPVSKQESVVFSLYTSAKGGSALWTEPRSVTPVDGVYSVQLGSVTAFPSNLFNNDTLYLGIKVGADPEMTARQQLTMAPYAVRAATADSLTSATWSQILPAAERFVVVMGDAAVLDKETGLVWERDTVSSLRNWNDAIYYCYASNLGGRKGWRLPSVEELSSLIDPAQNNPALPAGHPFTNVHASYYWSSTTYAGNPGGAWSVGFSGGGVNDYDKYDSLYVRCVRGGQ